MQKIFISIFILILSTLPALSQSFNVFDIDTTNFPLMKAKFYAFDKDGKQYKPNASELQIKENGIIRTISNVSCPTSIPPLALSSVLVLDVSGSMASGYSGIPNLELAKKAANTLINALPLGQSECAITTFDDANYLNLDFTTNKTKLINAITSISPQGGTDYDAALINPMAGGLLISNKAKYKKVIVLLTDGQASDPQISTIIAEANRQNCIIFCVTLGMPAPQSLKDIASGTRGQTFENVITIKEVEDVYKKILNLSQGGSPCEISWFSDISCNAYNTNVELSWQGLKSSSAYTPPNSAIVKLKVSPNFIAFGKKIPTTQNDRTITLTALNFDFTVTNIKLKFGSSIFSIINISFPFTIPKNTSKDITLRCTPLDSSMNYATFEIETDLCPAYFSANGGYPGVKMKTKTIKLNKPNGGEIFVAGSDTIITWEGISPLDTCTLELSRDKGITWEEIDDKANNLSYNWNNIPTPLSNQCLIKVSQNNKQLNIDSATIFSGHTGSVSCVALSNDFTKIVTGSEDYTAKVWDANTGVNLKNLKGHAHFIYCVAISSDGTKIVTGSADKTAKVWDANTGSLLLTLAGHTEGIVSAAFNIDGSQIITGSGDKTAKIWDANSGLLIRTLTGFDGFVSNVAISSDGTKYITGGGYNNYNTAIIWNSNSGTLINYFPDYILTMAISQDGTKIIDGSFNKVNIWDVNNFKKIKTFTDNKVNVKLVAISNDGSKACALYEDSTLKILNADTGEEIGNFTIDRHSDLITSLLINNEGSKIVTGSRDKTAIIWSISPPILQSDTSNAVFSIVAPKVSAFDIDMGKVLVNSSKDSVMQGFIKNIGGWKCRIDSIYFEGGDFSQFQVVSGIPPFTVDTASSKSVEFRLKPGSVGVKNSTILIITQADTLKYNIKGEGVQPQLQIEANLIDFGTVHISDEYSIQDTIVLKNITANSSINITNTLQLGPDMEQFEIVSGGGSFTLNGGETRKMTLKFKPKYGGRTSGQICFEYNGTGSPIKTQLFGTGIGGYIHILDDSAYNGETKNLNLILDKVKIEGLKTIADKFSAKLRLQKYLLAPIGNFNQTYSNDSVTLEVSGKLGSSNTLASIPVFVGLGNAEETDLEILDFKLLAANGDTVDYDVEIGYGTFKLLGVCKDGGDRLLNTDTKKFKMSIMPNPVGNSISVNFEAIEKGLTKLYITDITGNTIETLMNQEINKIGLQSIECTTSNIPSGEYFITVQSPTMTQTEKIKIVK